MRLSRESIWVSHRRSGAGAIKRGVSATDDTFNYKSTSLFSPKTVLSLTYILPHILNMSHVIISGGSTPGGGTPNRLEINSLIQDQVQFSLYIQALSKLLF